jgi:hypothetical protein
MKKLIIVLISFLSLQTQASLISFETNQMSYLNGEQVIVDVLVNNINPDAAEFDFDITFDSSALTFDRFAFSDDVLFSAFIFDAQLASSGDMVDVFSLWFDSIDLPASSFNLAQVTFVAKTDITPLFSVENLAVFDNAYNELPPQAQVPEPETLILFSLALLGLTGKRKHITKRK